MDDRRGAGRDERGGREVERTDVVERPAGETQVGAREAELDDVRQVLPRQVGVGDHHALRAAGRARGVEDRGVVVGVDLERVGRPQLVDERSLRRLIELTGSLIEAITWESVNGYEVTDEARLLASVRQAAERVRQSKTEAAELDELQSRFESLSARQRDEAGDAECPDQQQTQLEADDVHAALLDEKQCGAFAAQFQLSGNRCAAIPAQFSGRRIELHAAPLPHDNPGQKEQGNDHPQPPLPYSIPVVG